NYGTLNHFPDVHQVAGEVVVGQLHALRQPGGAGREWDSGNRVRVDGDLWSWFRGVLQGCELHGEHLRELLHVGRADEQLGSGSLDDVFHVCLVHEHADRVDDSARPQNAKQTGGEVDG